MADPKREFHQNYLCPKCRGSKPHVREIAFAKSGILDLLPSKDNRYIEVTCSLCGYTEFYNRALYLKSGVAAAEARVKNEMPIPKEVAEKG